MFEVHVVTVAAAGFAIEGFHSCISSVEHLHVSEIEDVLSETLVSRLMTHDSLAVLKDTL